jgi:transposase
VNTGMIRLYGRAAKHQRMIGAAGAAVLFLPPYSPDFGPIELMWSKIKAVSRKLKIRVKGLLDEAIAQAFSAISLSDISGWFRHDGSGVC